jgi:hypothetical protein
LFQWSANYEKSSRDFENATKAYKRAGEAGAQKLQEAYQKGAEAFQNNRDFYKAAQMFHQAAEGAAKAEEWKSVRTFARASVDNYTRDSKVRSAADMLYILCGKTEANPEVTIYLYKEAAGVWNRIPEDCIFSERTYDGARAFSITSNNEEEAIYFMQHQNNLLTPYTDEKTYESIVHRNMLMILLVQLKLGMYVQAVKDYEVHLKFEGFQQSSMGQAAQRVIEAVCNASQEQFRAAVSSSNISLLPHDVARFASQLTLDDELIAAGPVPCPGVLDFDAEDAAVDYGAAANSDLDGNDESEDEFA